MVREGQNKLNIESSVFKLRRHQDSSPLISSVIRCGFHDVKPENEDEVN